MNQAQQKRLPLPNSYFHTSIMINDMIYLIGESAVKMLFVNLVKLGTEDSQCARQ